MVEFRGRIAVVSFVAGRLGVTAYIILLAFMSIPE
jgi:hypothetical protein